MMNTPALLGGKPVAKIVNPPTPRFDTDTIQKVVDLLEIGSTVGLGRTHKSIAEAEDRISDYHLGRKVLLLNSGQSALSAALMGLEIGYGDEVITTPYTWGATTASILACGAIPVFIDVDPLTGLLDPNCIEAAVTVKTKAIMVVHIYGQPADMVAINKVAARHKLRIIEDGSQAHGASIDGEMVGHFSDAAGFSCMGGKLLATSEAGYLVTNNETLLWQAALTTQHYGRSAETDFPVQLQPYVDNLVLTYRLSPLIATLFPSQLQKIPIQTANRQENAKIFMDSLGDCPLIKLPQWPEGKRPAWHYMTINNNFEITGLKRETLLAALNAEGIGAVPYMPCGLHRWPRMNLQDYLGPKPYWFDLLKKHSVRYQDQPLIHCDYKVKHSFEIPFTPYYQPDSQGMTRMAGVFHKLYEHLPALLTWQSKHNTGLTTTPVSAAIRAAKAYQHD